MRAPVHASDESMGAIVGRAVRDPSFVLIFLGFFSCGYQLAFVTAHFPAFVTEVCSPIPANGVLASLGITTTSALGAVALGGDRALQHRRHDRGRRARPALPEEVPAGADLSRRAP